MKKYVFASVFILIASGIALYTLKGARENILQKGATSGALEALRYFNFARTYPQETMPPDGFYKAYELSKQKLSKQADYFAEDSWTSIGPKNQGGRTLALAVKPDDPKIVYAGSASGGLWKLTFDQDGVNYSWERVVTGFPVLGVNSIAINPVDSDIMYIGTGEVYSYQTSDGGIVNRFTRGSYGIGLLKTTDGGNTWTKSIDWSFDQLRGVLSIAIDPQNPDIVFAGTTEGTFKSVDAGVTWTNVNPVLMTVDIKINPDDPNLVFASHGNFNSAGVGIYKSTDRGESWTKINVGFQSGLPTAWSGKALLDIYQASPNIIYADIAHQNNTRGLHRSIDNGENWERLSLVDYSQFQGWFAHFARVNPVDSSEVFLAGVEYGSSFDGGRTFNKVDWFAFYTDPTAIHADLHAFANDPTDPNTFYVASDGGVNRTTNGGVTFEDLNQGYITSQFYAGFASSATDPDLAVGGMQDNSTGIYTGDPDNWITYQIGGDGSYSAISPDNRTIYGSGQLMDIWKTTDLGANWTQIVGGLNRAGSSFIAPYVQTGPGSFYAGTQIVYFTNNDGATWTATNGGSNLITNAPVTSLAVSKTNSLLVYAMVTPTNALSPVHFAPSLFKTTNGGSSWTNVTGSLPDRFTVGMLVSPDNDDIVYVTFAGYGSSHLYRTLDGGANWVDIDNGNLPDVPTWAVEVDPNNPEVIYVGNDLGVYVSADFGLSWNEFRDGMPDASVVMDLSLSESNNRIRAVTHGNGVFERTLLDPDIITDVDDESELVPNTFELGQNYPNPFNPETTITFSMQRSSPVSLKIYSITGQEVKTLVNNKLLPPGNHSLRWDGKDSRGINVATGTYIYRLQAGDITRSKRMTLIK